MSGENALQRYDQWAFDKICDSAFGQSVMAGRLEVRRCGGCSWCAVERCSGCSDVDGNVQQCMSPTSGFRACAATTAACAAAARQRCAHPACHAVPSHQRHPRSHFALLQKLTFLRMGDMMIDNWSAFGAFLQRLTCPPS